MREFFYKKHNLLLGVLAVASIAFFLAMIVFQARALSVNAPIFHLDGSFQTASGLYRIDSGQLPGKDFFPYLGIGPLLLIFPIFKLAGGTLVASVFAARFITFALAWIGISVIFHLVIHPKRRVISLVGGAAFFMLIFLIATKTDATNVLVAFEPGNSLRPVRSSIAYLAALATYILITHWGQGTRRNVIAGLIVGVTLLWSNDFAIPTAGLISLFYVVFFYIKERPTFLRSSVTFASVALLSWIILLSLVTGGHPLELIKYNFLGVAKDQWWYFGGYEPLSRVFEISQLPRLFSNENYMPLAVLAVVFVFAAWTKKLEHVMLFLIGAIMFAGGALASIAGHLGGYFGGFYFWGCATATLMAFKVLHILVFEKGLAKPKYIAFIEISLGVLVCISLLFFANEQRQHRKQELNSAKNDPNRYYVPEFGGYLSKEFEGYINYARKHKDSRIIEEYWGLFSSLNRRFPSWPVDAVIHALGNVREPAKAGLADADLLVTTRHATEPLWQQWNLSQNYWFYEEIISRREPDFISPTTVVWKKTDKPRELIPADCTVSKDSGSVEIGSGADGFYAVTLSYTVAGPGRYLLMLKNNISFAAGSEGYVSLPPGKSTVTVPALVDADSGHKLDIRFVGNTKVKVAIDSCVAKKIGYKNEEVLYEHPADLFYLTDPNWVRGVSRLHAGFFVPNDAKYREKYKVGRFVSFKNNDSRKITSVLEFGMYLNIEVDGALLDPWAVGLPREFKVDDSQPLANTEPRAGFYLTDENWTQGVAKRWAGFFVPNSDFYTSEFKPGSYVMLRDGERRKISRVEPAGEYLNVYVEGAILSPAKSGIPSQYKVEKLTADKR